MSFYCADTSERFLPPPPAGRPRGGLNSVSYQRSTVICLATPEEAAESPRRGLAHTLEYFYEMFSGKEIIVRFITEVASQNTNHIRNKVHFVMIHVPVFSILSAGLCPEMDTEDRAGDQNFLSTGIPVNHAKKSGTTEAGALRQIPAIPPATQTDLFPAIAPRHKIGLQCLIPCRFFRKPCRSGRNPGILRGFPAVDTGRNLQDVPLQPCCWNCTIP